MNDITIRMDREAAINWLRDTNEGFLQNLWDIRMSIKDPSGTARVLSAVSCIRAKISYELNKG